MHLHYSLPLKECLHDSHAQVDKTRPAVWVCSLVEGKVLADSMSKAHEKMKHAKQWTETVVQVLQKLLQVGTHSSFLLCMNTKA